MTQLLMVMVKRTAMIAMPLVICRTRLSRDQRNIAEQCAAMTHAPRQVVPSLPAFSKSAKYGAPPFLAKPYKGPAYHISVSHILTE